jgi:hypothetical protein
MQLPVHCPLHSTHHFAMAYKLIVIVLPSIGSPVIVPLVVSGPTEDGPPKSSEPGPFVPARNAHNVGTVPIASQATVALPLTNDCFRPIVTMRFYSNNLFNEFKPVEYIPLINCFASSSLTPTAIKDELQITSVKSSLLFTTLIEAM